MALPDDTRPASRSNPPAWASAGPWIGRSDRWVGLTTLLLIVVWETSRLDPVVTGWFGDRQGFALQHRWVFESLIHQGGRWLCAAALCILAYDAWRPLVSGPTRAERRWWLGSTIAVLILVPALKRVSSTSCPWSVDRFGGDVPYVPHWLPGVHDGGPGHCFPSGHAVAAFVLLGVYFLWRRHRPRAARIAAFAVLALGAIFGAAQLVRGAHYVSHTLWSGWLCWALFCVADAIGRRLAIVPPAPVAAVSSN